ncbi:Sir2 family NAD-dependent protein deacetylase [Konateibacter massiliensis]|uniref:Sir2 family NAD-dependent protein deacetylase n=1 Tax=Konateibacter massiliensis TaxID=2002841 RepID=UPI000C14C085|nr:Sir2 family NAD-dependent protein deacetylase [Konateibacter massiliensis]
MSYEVLENLIRSSSNLVCMCGLGMYKENGYRNFREDEEAYEIEMSYGYSPEELFSSTFFHTRTELFYKYYKDSMLQLDIIPNKSFEALAKLEDMGKLKCTVTRSVHGALEEVGCRKVVNMLGTITDNTCPRCHKKYPVEFIKNSRKVPLCERCNATIRPGVTLIGEMIANSAITEAATAIGNADTLLVLGCNINVLLAEKFLQYYNGDNLILITKEKHYTDKLADYVIHEAVEDVLPRVVDRLLVLN